MSRFRNLFRRTFLPLFALLFSPLVVLLIWTINTAFGGSILAFVREQGFTFFYQYWKPFLLGTPVAWMIIAIFAAIQLTLMRLVPGKRFEGPITPKGNVPVYRANGFSCYLITLALFFGCSCGLHLFSPIIVYDHFPGLIGALNFFGLIFCLFLYAKGRFFPSSSDSGSSGNFIFDYYWGTELYPKLAGWDLKMFTNCRFGLMAWPLIVLSFAAKQVELYGLADSMLVSLIILMTYLTKFFIWETGYLGSIDIMHDRAGFYICWSCLVFVPVVYTSPVLYLVNHPVHLGLPLASLITVLGVSSVLINFFADRERQIVRATNGDCLIWEKKPDLVHAEYKTSDGKVKKRFCLLQAFGALRDILTICRKYWAPFSGRCRRFSSMCFPTSMSSF